MAQADEAAGVGCFDPGWGVFHDQAVRRRQAEPLGDRLRHARQVAVQRLEDAGVTFVRGHGRLAGERRVDVAGATYVARSGVVLNPGTDPAVRARYEQELAAVGISFNEFLERQLELAVGRLTISR